MVEILTQILDYLVANYALYMVVTMSIIISLTISLITLIKKPVKKLTGKISDERIRKFANKIFIVFAFAISGACWVSLHFAFPEYFSIDIISILFTGASSIVVYALADGVVTKSKAQQIVETIKDFAEEEKEKKSDTKNNKKESNPIDDFWKKVK